MSSLFDRLQTDTPARRWIAEHLDYPHSEWCLFWPFGLNQGGYAQVGAEAVKVHRIMCEHKHGPAPDDRPFAAHECGNGNVGCVNPNHILWKTHAENMLDMHKHTPRGSRYKLTPAQVDEIRALQGRARIIDIAEQFGVCDVTIRQIHSGKIWRDTSSQYTRVLTEAEVLAIRATPWQVKSARQWAEELGSTRSAIDRVRAGTTYKWVGTTEHFSTQEGVWQVKRTVDQLISDAGQFAEAQEHLAARSKEDFAHWHHVALASLLREMASALSLAKCGGPS